MKVFCVHQRRYSHADFLFSKSKFNLKKDYYIFEFPASGSNLFDVI